MTTEVAAALDVAPHRVIQRELEVQISEEVVRRSEGSLSPFGIYFLKSKHLPSDTLGDERRPRFC